MKSKDVYVSLIAGASGILILALITSVYLADSLAWAEAEKRENERYYEGLREVFYDGRPEMKTDSHISVFDIISCWIEIPGTEIDYPVMQEGDVSGYYLDHRPDGTRASSGCLFIPAGDSADSDNIIIYGHHMRNGSMFAGLERYRDRTWAAGHSLIKLYCREGIRNFRVIGVIVQSMENRSFMWDNYIAFPDPASSFRYGTMANGMSVYGMDPAPLSEDRINRYLTLVTCDYGVRDGRLAVVACEI